MKNPYTQFSADELYAASARQKAIQQALESVLYAAGPNPLTVDDGTDLIHDAISECKGIIGLIDEAMLEASTDRGSHDRDVANDLRVGV